MMVEKTVLNSGLIVISEFIPTLPSFALSYSLRSGSRNESAETNGIHHLVEHMIFKGSQNYDLKKIADVSDRLGGRLNAFTGKEITQFYLKVGRNYTVFTLLYSRNILDKIITLTSKGFIKYFSRKYSTYAKIPAHSLHLLCKNHK